MRVLVAANLTPFLTGGAQAHIKGLCHALAAQGHQVECLQLPFSFFPESQISQAMRHAAAIDMTAPSGQSIDRLIGLQFPAYGVHHPNAVAWVMHQHRAVYDLYPTDASAASKELIDLKAEVHAFDQKSLKPLADKNRLFANSLCVAKRLDQFNALKAQPLYHPPPEAEHYFCADQEGYFFFPSRFETLKRQSLVIEAAKRMRSNALLVLAGEGGQWQKAHEQVQSLGLQHKVKLLGAISAEEKWVWMSRCLAVCYPPQDEDYGYVTLEAMLASKPVVTCTDSGGPLEFIEHEHNGLVVPPQPEALAQAMDALAAQPTRAASMGRAGRASYQAKGIGWPRVVQTLLEA